MTAPNDVLVIGVGAVTPIGSSAAETAASLGAGVFRFAERAWEAREGGDTGSEPLVVAEVPDDVLPDLAEGIAADPAVTDREGRLLRLAAAALPGVVEAFGPTAGPVGLVLALPDGGAGPADGAAFLARLAIQTGGAFDPAGSAPIARGRAGGLVAVGEAAARIGNGQAHFMLAGGVDSLCDPSILAALDREGRLRSADRPAGLVPGEAAAFLSLASRHAAATLGLTALARLSITMAGFEDAHLLSDEPCLGDGLTAVLEALFEYAAPAGPVGAVYDPQNGEAYWGREWGTAFLRNRAAFDPEARLTSPLVHLGDCGAAAGAVCCAVAVGDVLAGVNPGPGLVCMGSDDGERAALLVSPP